MTDFTFEDTRRTLHKVRKKVGAKEPAGHAASNAIGVIENLADLGNEFQEWQLKNNLVPLTMRQLAERLQQRETKGE